MEVRLRNASVVTLERQSTKYGNVGLVQPLLSRKLVECSQRLWGFGYTLFWMCHPPGQMHHSALHCMNFYTSTCSPTFQRFSFVTWPQLGETRPQKGLNRRHRQTFQNRARLRGICDLISQCHKPVTQASQEDHAIASAPFGLGHVQDETEARMGIHLPSGQWLHVDKTVSEPPSERQRVASHHIAMHMAVLRVMTGVSCWIIIAVLKHVRPRLAAQSAELRS